MDFELKDRCGGGVVPNEFRGACINHVARGKNVGKSRYSPGIGEKPLIRAVISDMPGGVLVCMPDHASAIRGGQIPAPMLGFSKKDVFAYDPVTAAKVEAGKPVDWSRLRPV
jgi:hypothetical protein